MNPTSPPRIVSAPGTRHVRVRNTLWISVIEGSFTTVFFTWTSGAVLTGYLLHLGAGPLALGAVASAPLLAQVINPLAAWIATRFGRRLAFISATAALGRGAWILAPLLPFLPLSPAERVACLVGIVAVSSLFQTCAGPPWIALMADIVPENIRGRYFGARNAVVGVIAMLAALASGLYLDRAAEPGGFQFVLVLAVLAAAIGIVLYLHHDEPRSEAASLSLRETILVPLRDANFRRFIAFSMYWQAAVMIASPFVIPYFLQHLHMSFTQIAVWMGIASLCGLVTGPMWGRIADHVGHRTVLTITMFIAGSIHPLCWMIATPGALLFIWISGVLDALSWGGINAAMFNLGIASTPPRHRMAYMAVLGMASGLTGCLAALASGPLLAFLLEHDFTAFGYHWTGYHSLFVIAILLRTQTWRLLRRVHEPHAWSTKDLLRDLWSRRMTRMPWRIP